MELEDVIVKHLVGRSSFEGDIIPYYELFFYQGKEEYVENVVSYISAHAGDVENKNVIDVGCGTGIFAEALAKRGANVLAVDISKDMIGYAQQNHSDRSIEYQVLDICNSPIDRKGDLAIALSHVVGYQLQNDRLRKFLCNISNSLKMGGIFAFNFYNESAILSKNLVPQFRQVHAEGITITRISNVVTHQIKNILQMKYRYLIEREKEELIDIYIEEGMRYYSLMELDNCLHSAGFKIKTACNFLTENNLSWDEWNGFIVAEKVNN